MEATRRRPKGTDARVDWNTVTGLDLANDERLALRYVREVAEPFRRQIERWRNAKRRAAFKARNLPPDGDPSAPCPCDSDKARGF